MEELGKEVLDPRPLCVKVLALKIYMLCVYEFET